jgi:type IV/VI secretion system ImpK/VasF family protein
MKNVSTDNENPIKAYTQRLINPIVSAAAPLLDAVVRPTQVKNEVDAKKIKRCFIKQIENFESQLKDNGFRALTVLMAKHLLCAFIDEMVLLQAWAKSYSWEDESLSWHFAHKKLANEDFFMILERASKQKTFNLDILELGYVCLSLGFQGKYRYLNNGQAILAVFSDNIYDVIRKKRGEHSRQLFIPIPAAQKKRWFLQLPSKRGMFIGAVIALLIIGGSYHYRLSPLLKSIDQAMKTLQINIQNAGKQSE